MFRRGPSGIWLDRGLSEPHSPFLPPVVGAAVNSPPVSTVVSSAAKLENVPEMADFEARTGLWCCTFDISPAEPSRASWVKPAGCRRAGPSLLTKHAIRQKLGPLHGLNWPETRPESIWRLVTRLLGLVHLAGRADPIHDGAASPAFSPSLGGRNGVSASGGLY